MLNKIVAVSWEHGASDVGRGAFPPHLSRCAERHDPSLGPFLLRVGLVYPSVGVVLLDTPVHWDREAGAIVLTAAQKTQLDTRLALAMGGGDRVEIPTARCGIAEQLTRPAFGAEVAALIDRKSVV